MPNVTVIPHGIGEHFKNEIGCAPLVQNTAVRILYVSNLAPYKHHHEVVSAASLLANEGFDVELRFVGGGSPKATDEINRHICKNRHQKLIVELLPHVDNAQLPSLYQEANICVFASSCENLPVTLLEAMATGIPIACSNRGPMPEVLGEDGAYFNPEDYHSIANILRRLIEEPEYRKFIGEGAKKRSERFTWSRCATNTLRFLSSIRDQTMCTR